MAERLRTFLLIATLMAATAGATVGIMSLKGRGEERGAVMIVRLGHAPVEWNGWQLIPPSDSTPSSNSQGCDRAGYDACSDGEEGEPMDSSDDNAPNPI